MDYKRKLIKNIDFINNQEQDLINRFSDEKEKFLWSYDNWTFKDVISHISEWRFLASEKLALVKKSESVPFHEDLDVLNKQFYEKHKNQTIEDIRLFSAKSCKDLKKQIESFDNWELLTKNKIDDYKSALWQYILMDSFVHPTAHMVFYCIKVQNFKRAFKIFEYNYILLLQLDNSKKITTNYFYIEGLLNELDGMVNKDTILLNLKEFQKRNMKSETVSSIVLDHFMTINNII